MKIVIALLVAIVVTTSTAAFNTPPDGGVRALPYCDGVRVSAKSTTSNTDTSGTNWTKWISRAVSGTGYFPWTGSLMKGYVTIAFTEWQSFDRGVSWIPVPGQDDQHPTPYPWNANRSPVKCPPYRMPPVHPKIGDPSDLHKYWPRFYYNLRSEVKRYCGNLPEWIIGPIPPGTIRSICK